MSEKLREAAKAALDAMKLARGDHGTIMLAYPAIESWLYHRVDQRLDDAIKEVDDALAEATVKNSLTVQRPWVGLTAEDMADAHNSTSGDVMMRLAGFARAIETMLRERNGG